MKKFILPADYELMLKKLRADIEEIHMLLDWALVTRAQPNGKIYSVGGRMRILLDRK